MKEGVVAQQCDELRRGDAAAGGGFELNVSVIARRRAFLFRYLCIIIIAR